MLLVDVYDQEDAVNVLYQLLEERSIEDDPYVNISHRKLPSWAEHNEFFSSHPFYVWRLIAEQDKYLGYVSVTWRNEIGIVLFEEFRGRGCGTDALKLLLKTVKPLPAVPAKRPGNFVANINPANERSIAMFQKLGFKLLQHTYELRA